MYSNNYSSSSENNTGSIDPENILPVRPVYRPQYQSPLMQGPCEPKKVFTLRDTVFALIFTAIGFIILKLFFTFSGEVMFSGYYNLITALLGISALIYIGKRPNAVQWLIFGCAMLFCSVPFFASSEAVRFFSWVYAAILLCYFAYSFSSSAKPLSDGFIINLAASLLAAPIMGFTSAPKAIFKAAAPKRKKSKNALYIFIGLLVSLPAVLITAMLLSYADENFGRISANILLTLTNNFGDNIFIFIFSLPLSFLLFGIVSHARCRKKTLSVNSNAVAFAPAAAVCAALAPIIMIYIILLICQLPYFTGAFSGVLPEGYSYSEFARRGFFELCTVAVINLVIIILSAVFSKNSENGKKPKTVRGFSIAFCVMTVMLIVSAMSKMLLYINEMGLTRLRLYTSWFMILLGLVFAVEIIRQICPKIPTVKLQFAVFTVCLGVLCFSDPDARIAQYNTERYISGSMNTIDMASMSDLSESAAPYIAKLKGTKAENDMYLYFDNQELSQNNQLHFPFLFN